MSTHESEELSRLLRGHWVAQAVHVAARLGIADLLKDGPVSIDQLAKESNVNERNLYRLLRALASVGIFAEESGEPIRFRLTPLADNLRRDVADSQWGLAILMGEHFQAWGHLLHTVRTGETAFDHCFGGPLFDVISRNPEIAAIADQSMANLHARQNDFVVEACDCSGLTTLVDVGGGSGSLIAAIMRQYQNLQGVLFDRLDVIERLRTCQSKPEVAGRFQAIAGDFFESVPAGADGYLLARVLHDWNDELATKILRNCYLAMRPGGQLLVVECIVPPPGVQSSPASMLDLAMMVLTGGLERTAVEYAALFKSAGFTLTRIVPTVAGVKILEAT